MKMPNFIRLDYFKAEFHILRTIKPKKKPRRKID